MFQKLVWPMCAVYITFHVLLLVVLAVQKVEANKAYITGLQAPAGPQISSHGMEARAEDLQHHQEIGANFPEI